MHVRVCAYGCVGTVWVRHTGSRRLEGHCVCCWEASTGLWSCGRAVGGLVVLCCCVVVLRKWSSARVFQVHVGPPCPVLPLARNAALLRMLDICSSAVVLLSMAVDVRGRERKGMSPSLSLCNGGRRRQVTLASLP